MRAQVHAGALVREFMRTCVRASACAYVPRVYTYAPWIVSYFDRRVPTQVPAFGTFLSLEDPHALGGLIDLGVTVSRECYL